MELFLFHFDVRNLHQGLRWLTSETWRSVVRYAPNKPHGVTYQKLLLLTVIALKIWITKKTCFFFHFMFVAIITAWHQLYVRLKQTLLHPVFVRNMQYWGHAWGRRRTHICILVEKPEEKSSLERPRCRWKNTTNVDVREIGCGGMGVCDNSNEPIYSSTALWLWQLFQFRDFLHSLDGGSARRKAATCTKHNTNRINAYRHPCLKWDSNPRSQCSSGRREFIP
jgi:hypothetical protein